MFVIDKQIFKKLKDFAKIDVLKSAGVTCRRYPKAMRTLNARYRSFKMKKFFVLSLSLVLLALASATLVGCKDDPEPEQLYAVVKQTSVAASVEILSTGQTKSQVTTYIITVLGYTSSNVDWLFSDPGVRIGDTYYWHNYLVTSGSYPWYGIYKE
jgi:hypothetical protein